MVCISEIAKATLHCTALHCIALLNKQNQKKKYATQRFWFLFNFCLQNWIVVCMNVNKVQIEFLTSHNEKYLLNMSQIKIQVHVCWFTYHYREQLQ